MNPFPIIKANAQSLILRRPLYGIGINDADYVTKPRINGKQIHCPFYKVWNNMLNRCYSEKSLLKRPTYKDCYVCEEWRSFMAFKSWMEKQDWEGNQLDKDIIIEDNKVYGPDKCLFVTMHINSLFTNSGSSRGKYPQGVHLQNQSNRFIARISIDGISKHLGIFNTPEEAESVYKINKSKEIFRQANLQKDLRVKNILLERAKNYA